MKLTALLPIVVLTLLAAQPAAAAAAEGEGQGGLLSPETGLMVWTLIVFAIVLTVLYKFVFPHILGAVEAREAAIRELMAAAARDREEAQALLDEQKKQIEEVRGRAQELMAEGREAGERVREEILAEARREQEQIVARARREVQQEMENAIEQLRLEAVELAIAAASRLLQQNLDAETNRRLVREFLDQIEVQGREPMGAGA